MTDTQTSGRYRFGDFDLEEGLEELPHQLHCGTLLLLSNHMT